LPTAEFIVNAPIVILLAEAIKLHSTKFKLSGYTLKGLPPAPHPPYRQTTPLPHFTTS